jgi:hypothetical protein
VQSLLSLQLLAQVAWQKPSQQIGVVPVPVQSEDCVHALGQGWYVGFVQTPPTPKFGSKTPAVVQQISPLLVLHSESEEQPVGHSPAGVQMGVL